MGQRGRRICRCPQVAKPAGRGPQWLSHANGKSIVKISNTFWRWAFGLCVVAVLVLALAPAPPQVITTGWDKTNHLLAFAVMLVLGRAAFPRREMTLMLLLLAFGGLIELLQYFVAYRSAEWGDWLADAVGLLVGWGVVRLKG